MEERGSFKGILEFTGNVLSGKKEFASENKIFTYSIGTLAILIIGTALAYLSGLRDFPNSTVYLPFYFLAIIVSVMTSFSYFHIWCYKKRMTCSNGMMVGMTVGMISGLLVGLIIGATNGMFYGSLLGIVFGVGLGVKLGKCCGIMGALEGMMAGLMAGIMGAMTAVMLVNDNLILFLYFFFGLSAIILYGLSYMMFKEAGTVKEGEFKTGFLKFFLFSLILFAVLLSVMLFGPKGIIVYN